jgi:hypothetical protein
MLVQLHRFFKKDEFRRRLRAGEFWRQIMNIHRSKINDNEKEVRVITGSIRTGINLDGLELLKLDFRRPGANVMCTNGALWLTQQGDPVDHLLQAGQSFTLDQRGIVLVQGLLRGKALIRVSHEKMAQLS